MKKNVLKKVNLILALTILSTSMSSNILLLNAKELHSNDLSENSFAATSLNENGSVYLVDVPSGNSPSQAVQTLVSSIPNGAMALKVDSKNIIYKDNGDNTFTVDFHIENNKGFNSIGFSVMYDETMIKPIQLSDKEKYDLNKENGFIKYKNSSGNSRFVIPSDSINSFVKRSSNGKIKFAILPMDEFILETTTESGKLCRLKFEALKEGTATIKPVVEKGGFIGDINGHNVVPMYVQESKITIVKDNSIVYGDINGDGIVAVTDVAPLMNYINGKVSFNESQKKAADINQDGKINKIDVNILEDSLIDSTVTLPVTYVVGDINGDGVAAVTDIAPLTYHINGTKILRGIQKYAADVDGDGEITNKDKDIFTDYLIGIIDKFPAEEL